MSNPLQKFFSGLPLGARALLLAYALCYPLSLAGHYSHSFELSDWLALSPPLLWKGEAWCAFTYAFLPAGPVDWAVSLFWLATLLSVLGRDWSALQLWVFCLLTAGTGALAYSIMAPSSPYAVVGNGAIIFGLLAAWYRLYGLERIILLGIGEISVRQAAVIIAIIEALVLFFCLGWKITLAMACGGLVGWLYLAIAGRRALSRRSQVVSSERVARLEL